MDALSKTSVDNLAKENKQLKKKLEKIKRENRDLKKSVYDLSVRYNLSLQQAGHLHKPFDIDAVLSIEGGEAQKTSNATTKEDPGTTFLYSCLIVNSHKTFYLIGFQYRGWNAGASVSNKKADSKKFYHKKTFTVGFLTSLLSLTSLLGTQGSSVLCKILAIRQSVRFGFLRQNSSLVGS